MAILEANTYNSISFGTGSKTKIDEIICNILVR